MSKKAKKLKRQIKKAIAHPRIQISSCNEALEAALDHNEKLQLRIFNLEAALANYEDPNGEHGISI